MDPGYFWHKISQDEISSIIKAKSRSEDEDKRRSWEQIRMICFYTLTSFQGSEIKLKDGRKIKIETPKDLFPLSWEEPEKKKKKLTSIKEIRSIKKQFNG